MPEVAVVVPWRPGCPHRGRALTWVRGRYTAERPTWTLELGETPAVEPWSKAAAVMPVIERSSADIVIVADADVWTWGIASAVTAVAAGAAWAVPHTAVHRLDERGTAAVLAGAPWHDQPLAERPYRGLLGGGIVVARRDALLQAPLDRRFVGWGQEDTSWALALDTMLGAPWRGATPLIHLWHPPQPRMSRRRGSVDGWALFRRYHAAHGDQEAMRALIEEAACPSPSC